MRYRECVVRGESEARGLVEVRTYLEYWDGMLTMVGQGCFRMLREKASSILNADYVVSRHGSEEVSIRWACKESRWDVEVVGEHSACRSKETWTWYGSMVMAWSVQTPRLNTFHLQNVFSESEAVVEKQGQHWLLRLILRRYRCGGFDGGSRLSGV